jgi:hypothetical protein
MNLEKIFTKLRNFFNILYFLMCIECEWRTVPNSLEFKQLHKSTV